MISKKEFFNLYNRNSPDNKNRSVGKWISKLCRRKISFYVAYYFARLGISSNSVTLFSLLVAIISSSIFIIPTMFTLVLLFFAYELVYILDNVDGELARFHGTFSKYGELLDDLSDIFIASFFVMAFGIRMYLDSNNPLFLILGNLGTLSYVFEGLWVKNSKEIVGKFNSDNSGSLMHRLRTYLLSIDDVSMIAAIIIVLTFLQNLFTSINLVVWFFFLYIFVLFLTKILLRYCLILMKTKKVKKTAWEGWGS